MSSTLGRRVEKIEAQINDVDILVREAHGLLAAILYSKAGENRKDYATLRASCDRLEKANSRHPDKYLGFLIAFSEKMLDCVEFEADN